MKKPKGKHEDLGFGITIKPVIHARYAWLLNFYEGTGEQRTRKRLYFATKAAATKKGEEIRTEIESDGQEDLPITREERRAVMEFREMVGSLSQSITRPTLGEAVKNMANTLGIRHKSKSITELVESYLGELKKKDVSHAHFYSVEIRLNRFVESFGDWLACDTSQEVIEEWLGDLKFAPLTVNHYRTALVQLFKHALLKKMVEVNPAEAIPKRKIPIKPPGIFKPLEVAALLEKAPAEILAGMAIGFFAGVRRAELCRMDWSEIDFEQNLIEVQAVNAKSAKRRLIPLRPNLRAWLLPIRKNRGEIMPSEMIWRDRLAEAMTAANIEKWPHNAPRHSFASYQLAKFKNADALALEMGHTDTAMIFEHYRALVTPNAAKTYWKIAPANPETVTNIKSASA